MFILVVIKEYYSVWVVELCLDFVIGFLWYRFEGFGVFFEMEVGYFVYILEFYVEKYGCIFEEFVEGYNNGKIKEFEFDNYFMYDCVVCELGYDMIYCFEGCCVDFVMIDLNFFFFKYEMDIVCII